MRVVLIYRKPRVGAYSIEELFHTVAGELDKQVEVVEYEVGDRGRVLLDAWRLRQLDADIYHVTGDINYLLLLLPREKTVLTVHDIGLLLHLTGLKQWIYKWVWFMLPIRYAHLVTAVSEETRIRIEEHLGIRGKVTVITNCYGAVFRKTPQQFDQVKPRILQVGTMPHKNLSRVIEALRGVPCCLVIMGPLDNDLVSKLTETGIEYECHFHLTHEEVFMQYVRADVVCFASLHEGFGLPIIEAQVVGRPVITSNISPMCDVAGDSACLVDPHDIESIRKGIIAVLSSQDYRKFLVDKGYRNAARHSPASVASEYLQLYRGRVFKAKHEAGLP
ncbi:MAG TPA: glycosyltransferase family 1 protein [Bacteriovoracaceae bacterium]|nr:glycosyltransferase family 1 protein [Bacteriovoracaceae bacterium]